jgi:hypothetical protein
MSHIDKLARHKYRRMSAFDNRMELNSRGLDYVKHELKGVLNRDGPLPPFLTPAQGIFE